MLVLLKSQQKFAEVIDRWFKLPFSVRIASVERTENVTILSQLRQVLKNGD